MEIDNWCKYMVDQNIIHNDHYSKEQLSIYFDPFIYKHIKELKLDGININDFIIVFWDISKFSSLVRVKSISDKTNEKTRSYIS